MSWKQWSAKRQVATIVGAVVVLITFFAVAVILATQVMMKNDAYRQALVKIQNDAAAQQVFGAPIVAGTFVSGWTKTTGSYGRCSLHFPLHGSKAKGTVQLAGNKTPDGWRLFCLAYKAEAKPTTYMIGNENDCVNGAIDNGD